MGRRYTHSAHHTNPQDFGLQGRCVSPRPLCMQQLVVFEKKVNTTTAVIPIMMHPKCARVLLLVYPASCIINMHMMLLRTYSTACCFCFYVRRQEVPFHFCLGPATHTPARNKEHGACGVSLTVFDQALLDQTRTIYSYVQHYHTAVVGFAKLQPSKYSSSRTSTAFQEQKKCINQRAEPVAPLVQSVRRVDTPTETPIHIIGSGIESR